MTATMPTLYDTRRYLTNFDSNRTSHVLTDVLVIGSGVAGARAAIEASRQGLVTLLCKGDFTDSATQYAQGGIAVAQGDPSAVQSHYDDTMRVGCELNRPEAVRVLVHEGPTCIDELVAWGIEFDRINGTFALTREGGHSVNRIVHAHGDQTGRELVRTLRRRVEHLDDIRIFDHCFFLDFLTVAGVCLGAVAYHKRHGHQLIWAKQTVLASGGCGQIWRETTNPPVSTGDGLAAAYRAGARLCDLEMMQFHPTTLYVAGAGRALISEAVRGEGAYLVDRNGRRFMPDYHPDAELAPRDIVSRAIQSHLEETRANCVYLDVRHLTGFQERFPHIAGLCKDFEIDVTRDLIPVRPSAHYMIGGVDVQLDGSTTVEGLLCCGEASCTGVHGANRMASNSLLEGLVFGKRTGETAGRRAAAKSHPTPLSRITNQNPSSSRTTLDLPDIRNSLSSVMWRNVGIVRRGDRLRETCDILDFWGHYTLDKTFDDVLGWETQNKLTVARLIALSALERADSIGVHFRSDATSDQERIREPLSPAGGSDEPTEEGGSEGRVRGSRDVPQTSANYHVTVTRAADGTKPARVPVGA
jgi:L-aspartate oxidase